MLILKRKVYILTKLFSSQGIPEDALPSSKSSTQEGTSTKGE